MDFRGREFIFYWITVKEQISTQARKSNCSERNCLFESLPFLSSFVSLFNKSIFPCKTCHGHPPNATQKSRNGSLDSQSGGAHRQFCKSWNSSHKHELYVGLMDSDRSRSGFFGCRHSRPFLGSVTGAIFTQGRSTTSLKHLHKLKTLVFLASIYNSRLTKTNPKLVSL